MDFDALLYISSWPDVPLNRNNSEQEMFEIYYDIINKEAAIKQMRDNFDDDENEVKNNNEAQNFRTLGNKFYEDSNYDEALKFYNMSISRASRNSIKFGLAVANRSAVLFDMEKYEECLEDINTTLKSEYPKNLQYKIYLRQSKCYLKLKLNFEAAKSLRKAQECADKFNKLQIAPINDKIQEIKSQLKEELQQTAASASESNDDILFIEPTLKDEENPKFINAAKIVDFRYTTTLGRHVVAKNDIKKGDILFVEEPYAFSTMYRTDEDVRFNFCAFCLKRALHCIPCLICAAFFYCSDKCRKTNWDLGHRWECEGLRRKIIHDDQQFCLSVLFQASHDGFQTAIEDDSVYGNKENNYPFLNKLLTHKNDVSNKILKTYIKDSVWLVLYLKTFTDYFDWLYVQPNRPEGSLEELYHFVGGQLVKYLLQYRCNAVIIRDVIVRFEPTTCYIIANNAVGCGIFLSTSLLNHSCLPNAAHSFHGTKRIVKARQDIKKGTEITINYLEESIDEIKTKERQSALERYSFTCSCLACTDPSFPKLQRPFLCPRCSGKALQVQEEMFAKCSECHFIFNAIQHFQNNNTILDLNIMFSLYNDQSLLDEIYKLMKKTYHKDNLKYLHYYASRQEHYERKGDIKKCVDIEKLFLELCKNVYGDTSKNYLLSLMNLSYYLVKCCKTLSKKNTKNYKKLLDETKTSIKKSAEILQYFSCISNVKKYVDDITKYLNSDNDVFMKNIIILEDCD